MRGSKQTERERQAATAAVELFAGAGETDLGGRLFFAGELVEQRAVYLEAAMQVGAASLVVAGELSVGKAAMRAGTVNFVVNSLDEALRILKNEIRKKQRVAVCVVGALGQVVAEMQERGVRPDFVVAEVAEVGGKVVCQN